MKMPFYLCTTTIQQDVLKLSRLCGILNQGCASFSNKQQYVWPVDFILIPKIKFLGIYIQDSITWSCHINYITPKLSSSCYAMRSIKPVMSLNTLKTIYYSCFNAITSYGLPFWGNSPHTIKIFRIHKRIRRIILGCKKRVSCRNLFRKLKILPRASQYIL